MAGSEGEVSPTRNQTSSHTEHQNSSIYYEVDVTCPELTISGDSEYLDTSCHSNRTDQDLNCTLDLKSDSSSASINVGTQSDISMLSLGKNFEQATGAKKRRLEISPELDYSYKRMRFSRDRVSSRPPLRHRQIRPAKPTRDYILSVSPDKNNRDPAKNGKNCDLNQTCSIQ